MADTEYRQNDPDPALKDSGRIDPKNRGRDRDDNPENRDPISGAPGAHPVGTGVGAAVGGAALGVAGGLAAGAASGAAAGTAAGPIGTVVGAAIGAVAGGLAGKAIAENVNPTEEHNYWRATYTSRPYAGSSASYDDFGPAYQYGWETRSANPNRDFDDLDSDMRTGWEKAKGKSKLQWERAKEAARDSWNRMTNRDDRTENVR